MTDQEKINQTNYLLGKLTKLQSKSAYLDFKHRTKNKKYFTDINIVTAQSDFLDPIKNFVDNQVIKSVLGEVENTPIMFESTKAKELKKEKENKEQKVYNNSGIILLNYFKSKILSRQIFIDLLCNILLIFPSTSNAEIITKITKFTSTISSTEKRISLRYKILKLLFNLGILTDTDLLNYYFSNYSLVFETLNKDQDLVLLLKEFFEFYLAKLYSKNRGNPYYFPYISIFLPENTSSSNRLLIGKFLKSSFGYPFKINIFTQRKNKEIFYIPENQVTQLEEKDFSNQAILPYLIKNLTGNNINEFKLQKLIDTADLNLSNAHSLAAIFNSSRGFIETESKYGELLKIRLANLSLMAKTIIRFLVLFDGLLPKIFLEEILQNEEKGKIEFAVRELYLAGLIIYSKNYSYVVLSFYNDFKILDKSFDRNAYLSKNNLLVKRLLRRFFRTEFTMCSLAFNTEISLLAKKILTEDPITFNFSLLLSKSLFRELKEYFVDQNNHPDFLAVANYARSEANKMDPDDYLGSLFELGNYKRVIKIGYRVFAENLPVTSPKRILPLITSGISKAILRPEERDKYLKEALKGISLAQTSGHAEFLFKGKLWLSRFYQKNREFEKSQRYLIEILAEVRAKGKYTSICRLYYLLALNYYNLGKYENANEQADLALVHLNKHFRKFTEGLEKEKLDECFENSSDLGNPLLSEIIYLKALIKTILNNHTGSRKDFKKAIRGFELLGDYRNLFLCSMDYSAICEKQGEFKEAGSIIKKAFNLGRNYNDPEIMSGLYQGLAIYHITKNNLGKAKDLLESCMQFSATNKLSLHFIKSVEKRADLAYLENDYNLALKCLNYVLKKYGILNRKKGFPEVFLKMAKVYTDTKEVSMALKLLENFKRKNFKYYLVHKNQLEYNNLLIENYQNGKNFNRSEKILQKQYQSLKEQFCDSIFTDQEENDSFFLTKEIQSKILKNPDVQLIKFYYLVAIQFFKGEKIEEAYTIFEFLIKTFYRTKYPELMKISLKICDFYFENNFNRDSLHTLSRLAPYVFSSGSKRLFDNLLIQIRKVRR